MTRKKIFWLAPLFALLLICGVAVQGSMENAFGSTVPQFSFDRSIYNKTMTMVVTVTDGDSDTTGVADTLTVTVTSANGGGSATKVLTETGATTGIFTDSAGINFSTDPYSSTNGGAGTAATVQVTLSDEVTVSYTNPSGVSNSATREVRYSTGSFNNSTTSLLLTDAANIDTDSNGVFKNEAGGADVTYAGTGVPTAPTSGLAAVYLTDPDLNTNTAAPETPAVTLTTQDGTSQTLTLEETGNNTGVFRGYFYAPYASATTVTEADGNFATPLAAVIKTSAAGDTVTVSYTDTKDDGSAGTTSLEVPVGNGSAGSVTLSAATATRGSKITVTVTDSDLNQDPFTAETITATDGETLSTGEMFITSAVGGEADEIDLTETGPDTGVFVGKVTFNPGETAGDDDNELKVGASDVVTFKYKDANDGDADSTNDIKSATLTWNYSTGTVAVAPASVNDGSTLSVTVTDQDLNTSDSVVDTFTGNVTVVSKDSAGTALDTDDASAVTFTETGPATGVFVGTFTVNFAETANDNDGTIDAALGGSIVATYSDANTVSGAAGTASAAAIIGQNVGLLTLSSSAVDVNDAITVTLNDPDLNTSTVSAQTTTVNVKSTSDTTGIALTLTETGADTGIFSGKFTNAAASSAALKTLKVAAGDTITVTYVDASPSGNRTATATVTSNTGELALSKTHANLSDSVTVTLTEPDLNLSASAIDTITAASNLVVVKSNSDSTGTGMLLTETGVDTGIFTGSFATGAATVTGNVPTIKTADGDNISVTYSDAKNAGGTTQTVIASLTAGEVLGTVTIPVSVTLGDSITVQVADADYNTSTSVANTLSVNVSSTSDPVGIPLTLVETDADTGVFEKTVKVQTGSSVPESGILAASGDTLTVRYTDTSDTNPNTTAPAGTPVSATATVTEAQTLSVSPAEVSAPVGGSVTADVTGGIGDKFISVEPDSQVATASLDATTGVLTVTGVAEGTTTLTISDSASPTANTVDIPVTVAAATQAGGEAGGQSVDVNTTDSYELLLNITNSAGVAPADIAQEWLVFGANVGGVDAGVFFWTTDGSIVSFADATDPAAVTYSFDHSADTMSPATLIIGALGLSSGDYLWYGYAYSTTAVTDFADAPDLVFENYVVLNIQ